MHTFLLTVLATLGAPADDAAADRIRVYTTFYPTTYFTERIGGERVSVTCPLPDDADPIFWKPTPDILRGYQEADLVVVNGAELEKWVAQVSLPLASLVDTARPFRDEWLRYEEARTHSHGPEGEHSHSGIDGHTWLDPQNARRQAARVRDALVRRAPADEEVFRAAFDALARDLDALDGRFRGLGTLPDGQVLLASHPAYNYVARRYDWPVVNLDLDPEAVPTDEELAAVRERVGGRQALALLWEGAPADEVAARIEEVLGIASIEFSPCEMLGAEERAAGVDYLTVMNANLDRLAPIFGGGG